MKFSISPQQELNGVRPGARTQQSGKLGFRHYVLCLFGLVIPYKNPAIA